MLPFNILEIFLLAIAFYIVGLTYAIFCLKEIKVAPTPEESGETELPKNTNGVENMGFQDADHQMTEKTSKKEPVGTVVAENPDGRMEPEGKKKNFCAELFDPTLALGCIAVVTQKRENRKHFLIWFFILSYAIIAGTTQGEGEFLYQFTRLQLNWDGNKLSLFNTYNTILTLIGKVDAKSFLVHSINNKPIHRNCIHGVNCK